MNQFQAQEFIKHYSDTYVRIRDKDKDNSWRAVYFRTGEWQSKTKIYLEFYHHGKMLSYNFNDIEIDTSFPPSGVYPANIHGHCILFLTKPAARQWKWGLTKSNSLVRNILAQEIFTYAANILDNEYEVISSEGDTRFADVGFDEQVARYLLLPKYTPVKRGLAEVMNKDKFFAVFDKDYFCTVSPIHNGGLLWRWDIPIAKIYENTGSSYTIHPSSETFSQEVVDFFYRKGISNVHFEEYK